ESRIRHDAHPRHARRSARGALRPRRAPRRREDGGVRTAWRMLARDWRAGELGVLAAALVIAVASVTSVGFFAARVGHALERDAHQLLGADLVLAADHPWSTQIATGLRGAGVQTAEAMNFISMALRGEEMQLAGVK